MGGRALLGCDGLLLLLSYAPTVQNLPGMAAGGTENWNGGICRLCCWASKKEIKMGNEKAAWKSNTIWASAMAIIYAVLKFFGVEISDGDVVGAATKLDGVVVGVLGIWAMVGRWRATTRIAPLLIPLALVGVLMAGGCAANTAAMPQAQEQKADEIGPAFTVNGINIWIMGEAGMKLAEVFNVTIGDEATADTQQSGAADQRATQASEGAGGQDAAADAALEIPLVP